jgi:hypothetical protein
VGKIVCIGWNKTGSASLAEMLGDLGYSVTQKPWNGKGKDLPPLDADYIPKRVMPLLEQYDAFHDYPWNFWFPLVDRLYPGSKFIYTYRKSPGAWLASASAFYGQSNPVNEHLYNGHGLPRDRFAKRIWKARYVQHHEFVKAYFSRRNSDLLKINIDAGELTWESVCSFLGKEVPDAPIPHLNKRKDAKQPKT